MKLLLKQAAMAFASSLCVIFAQPISLSVALYPYIPDSCGDDFSAFEERIKTEFEALYPQVELTLRPLTARGNFYDYDYLKELLESYDVVEIDSIFVGELIEEGVIDAWGSPICEKTPWEPIASAICAQASPYVYPHWQCAYFAFSKNKTLTAVANIEQFLDLLEESKAQQTPLALDLTNAWSNSDIYMDALTDWNPSDDASWNISAQYYPQATAGLEALAPYTCTAWGSDPALNRAYEKRPNRAQKAFAKGAAHFYIGFAEDFSAIAQVLNTTEPFVYAIHAPWGLYHHPTLDVDALVLAKGLSAQQRYWAEKFAQYLSAAQTYQWMVLGEDCIPEPQGRYMLPGTRSAYTDSAIGSNAMMLQYHRIISQGEDAMPLYDYSSVARKLGNELRAALKNTTECP